MRRFRFYCFCFSETLSYFPDADAAFDEKNNPIQSEHRYSCKFLVSEITMCSDFDVIIQFYWCFCCCFYISLKVFEIFDNKATKKKPLKCMKNTNWVEHDRLYYSHKQSKYSCLTFFEFKSTCSLHFHVNVSETCPTFDLTDRNVHKLKWKLLLNTKIMLNDLSE